MISDSKSQILSVLMTIIVCWDIAYCVDINGTTCNVFQNETVCYTLSDDEMTWSDALTYCQNLPEVPGQVAAGGVLGAVYDQAIQDNLETVLSNVNTSFWLGGTNETPAVLEDNEVSQWRWVYPCDKCDTVTMLDQFAVEPQGCYDGDSSNKDLDIIANNTGSTVPNCIQTCTSLSPTYRYSGLQFDQTCSCGTQFGEHGTASSCSLDCDGNCGGYGAQFIYRHGGMFCAWSGGQPDNGGSTNGNEFCGSADLSNTFTTPNYPYLDETCHTLRPYICSFNNVDMCSDTVGYYNTTFGTCVFISSPAVNDTWHRARSKCWGMGGDLVIFEDLNQHTEVLAHARTMHPGAIGINIYIGLYREALVWRRAMREVEMNYYNFAVGQPIFRVPSTCLLMDPENTFTWTTDGCSNSHRALCYQGPDIDPEPTTEGPTVTETTNIATTTTATTTATTNIGSTTSSSSNTSQVVPPPLESTKEKLSQTEIILISVLVPLAVILIILLILFLIRVCRNPEGVGPAEDTEAPVAKEKVDARLQATKAQGGPIGQVDEGYFDMGSTANLIYNVKNKVVPKWKKSAGVSAQNTETIPDEPQTMQRRNSQEPVLIPDFNTPGPEPTEGRYEYEGHSSTRYDSMEGSMEPLIPPPHTYGAIPGQPDLPVTPKDTLKGGTELASVASLGFASDGTSGAYGGSAELSDGAQSMGHDSVMQETSVPVVVPPVTSDLGSSCELDTSRDWHVSSTPFADVDEVLDDSATRGSNSPLISDVTDASNVTDGDDDATLEAQSQHDTDSLTDVSTPWAPAYTESMNHDNNDMVSPTDKPPSERYDGTPTTPEKPTSEHGDSTTNTDKPPSEHHDGTSSEGKSSHPLHGPARPGDMLESENHDGTVSDDDKPTSPHDDGTKTTNNTSEHYDNEHIASGKITGNIDQDIERTSER